MAPSPAFLLYVELRRDRIADPNAYPFSLPALRQLTRLDLSPTVTFLVGENGSGKSTRMEALAIAAGFNAEGGSQNMRFALRPSESTLHTALRLVRGFKRPRSGYFFRAESFFNVATQVDQNPDALAGHGGRSLHEQSHGESFLQLVNNRFRGNGLYLLDEPEAALSPQRQLALLARIHDLVKGKAQFVIATHSPILMAYPGATLYTMGEKGIEPIAYTETEHYALTRDFLLDRDRYLARLLAD